VLLIHSGRPTPLEVAKRTWLSKTNTAAEEGGRRAWPRERVGNDTGGL